MSYFCDKGAELDDYLAKRISDCWAVRDAKAPIKAHYAWLAHEAETELQNHIKSCDQCSAHMARIA
jgi:hypothetical protein